jgi:hypothetical protein
MCDLYLFTASLSLTFVNTRYCPLSHFIPIAPISEHGQSHVCECVCVCVCVCVCGNVVLVTEIFGYGKIYCSNSITVTNFV